MKVDEVARICHEANRAYCASHGDHSQLPWDEAPDWQRNSAIAGVWAHIDSKFKMTPAGSHLKWMNLKLAQGWTYGPIKDEKKKTHPCIVPYEKLPLFQKAKDYIFTGIVHSLAEFLPHSGEQVGRAR